MEFKNELEELEYVFYKYVITNKYAIETLKEDGIIDEVLKFFNKENFDDDFIKEYLKIHQSYYANLKTTDLLILGASKTGTTSVFRSIPKDIDFNRSHGYYLDEVFYNKCENIDLGIVEKIDGYFFILDLCYIAWLRFINKNKKVNIIFTFRDPIASCLSKYFYRKYIHGTTLADKTEEEFSKDLEHIYSSTFIKKLSRRSEYYIRGLNNFGIDIANNIFPSYIEEYVILKLEDGICVNQKKLRDFIKRDVEISIDNANVIKKYNSIIKDYKLNNNEVKRIYASKYNSILFDSNIYNRDEYNKFVERWSK